MVESRCSLRLFPKSYLKKSLAKSGYVPLFPKTSRRSGLEEKITAETRGLMGYFKPRRWSLVMKLRARHYFRPCWMNHFIRTKPKRSKLCDIYSAVRPLFPGTRKHKLEELVTEYRDTLAVLWSHRESETLDFQESRASLLAREQKLPPHI